MVFNYLFFKYLRNNRGNGNGAILIGLGWIIYFFNRVNNNIFPLSWKKCLFGAAVVNGRQGLLDCRTNKFEKPVWETIKSFSFGATFSKNIIYSGRCDIINILWC